MQVYYPINTYSYNEMASFVGDIKRVVGPAPALASNGNSYILEVICAVYVYISWPEPDDNLFCFSTSRRPS